MSVRRAMLTGAFLLGIISLMDSHVSLSWAQVLSETKTTSTRTKVSIPVDISIPEFSKTEEGKDYLKTHRQLPPLRDAFNNPPPRTVYTEMREKAEKLRIKKKKQNLKKTPPKEEKASLKTSLLNFFINIISTNAYAYEQDVNFNTSTNCNGLIRCRANTSQTGYFKVYFEDVVANNCSGSGQGFSDPNLGQIRRDTVCDVLSEFTTLLKLDQTNITPDIVVRKNLAAGTPFEGLAIASAFYGSGHNASRTDNGTLHRHIVWRQDFTPGFGDFDAYLYVNWSLPAPTTWDVDHPGYPSISIASTSMVSFKTVLRHQFLHALGFSNRLEPLVNTMGTTWSMNEIQHTTFNEFLYNYDGSAYQRYYDFSSSQMTPILNTPPGNPSSYYINNSGFYKGSKNIAGVTTDDGNWPVFTQDPWSDAKSLSHFDELRSTGEQYLMNHLIDPGQDRDLHQHEKLVLCHLGYQVTGIPECESATPRAINDIYNNFAPNQCVPLLNNDLSYSGGTLSVHQVETADNLFNVTYDFFSNPDCTGALSASQFTLAKSIRFNNSNLKRIVLKYKIKDSNGNRVSEPALIELNNCSPDPDQLICNGDFEMGYTSGGTISASGNQAVSNNRVPFWAKAESSPDLVFRNRPGQIPNPTTGVLGPYWHNPWNFPYFFPSQGGVLGNTTIDMPQGSGNYAMYVCDYVPSQLEKAMTVFKSPAEPGVSYTISAWANVIGYNMYIATDPTLWPQPSTLNLRFRLDNVNSLTTIPWGVSSFYTPLDKPVQVNLQTPNAQWTLVSSTFTPTEQYQRLIVDFNMNGKARPHYLDNVSMKKTTPHSISGTVYTDSNVNGNMDGAEQGIAGVKVGLFNSNTNPPQMIDSRITGDGSNGIALGFYSFLNLSIPSSGYYYTAVVPENTYSNYTEPLQNSFLQTFNRARLIPFQNGGNITDQDFGVIVPGVEPPLSVSGVSGADCNYTTSSGIGKTADTSPSKVESFLSLFKKKKSTTKNAWGPPCGLDCGYIDLTVTTINTPYTVLWSGPNGFTSTDEDLTHLVDGTYTVTVTDSSGATLTQTFTIVNMPLTDVNGTLVQPTQGASDGSINLTVTGQGPFTYDWSSSNGFQSNSKDISNLAPGMYTVTVTGANGCPISKTFRIAPPVIISHVTSSPCNSTSSIDLTVTGGIPPYNFTWFKFANGGGLQVVPNSQGVEDVSGLATGNYTALVTDSGGLNTWYPSTGSIAVTSMNLTITGTVNSSTNSIWIFTVVGGGSPTSYSWSGPNNYTGFQQNATGITAIGTYTVTATYGNNCTKQVSFEVQPSCAGSPPATSFNTSLSSLNNVPLLKCYLITNPAGTSQCTYNNTVPSSASTGWNTACPSSVAGTNCCGWTNACGGGSSGVPPTTITGNPIYTSSGNNGGVNLTVTGQGPFTYLWSNGQTTQNLTNVPVGTYSVTVKNANGCTTQASFSIYPQIQTNLTQGTCDTYRSITATASGGLAPLTYSWYKDGAMYPSTSAPYTGLTPSNLPVGVYYLVVTDANGQQVQSSSVNIDAYTVPILTAVPQNATAPNYNNGKIVATVAGGQAPFNFLFNILGSSGPISSNVYTKTGIAGSNTTNHDVLVQDAKGCNSAVYNIKVLKQLTASVQVVPYCSTNSSTLPIALPMAVVSAAGGHGGYNYFWMNQNLSSVGGNTSTLFGVPSGNYTVTVKDNNTPQQITNPSLSFFMPPSAPTTTVTTNVFNATGSLNNGSVTVTVTPGLGPYTYTYTPGGTFTNITSNTHTRTGLAPGSYTVSVKTNYQCTTSKPFTVSRDLKPVGAESTLKK